MGYADDTYALSAKGASLAPHMRLTQEWLEDTKQGVNAKKSVAFSTSCDGPEGASIGGVAFPVQTEFWSLGAGIRLCKGSYTGPLLAGRMEKAREILSRLHGIQGDFSRRVEVAATMVAAVGLYALEVAPATTKDLRELETCLVKGLWGTSTLDSMSP